MWGVQRAPESVGVFAGQDIRELFEEYEAGSTPEALLVKDFDKVQIHLTLARNLQVTDGQAWRMGFAVLTHH